MQFVVVSCLKTLSKSGQIEGIQSLGNDEMDNCRKWMFFNIYGEGKQK